METAPARIESLLRRGFPHENWRLGSAGSGDLEMFIESTDHSAAGALVVFTQQGEVWVRFAPPQLCYPIDSDDELVAIVGGLLAGDLAFLHILDEVGDWHETTLVDVRTLDRSQLGERETLVRW
jgi:hypothetical protein